jgi:hypothetical protein
LPFIKVLEFEKLLSHLFLTRYHNLPATSFKRFASSSRETVTDFVIINDSILQPIIRKYDFTPFLALAIETFRQNLLKRHLCYLVHLRLPGMGCPDDLSRTVPLSILSQNTKGITALK